MPEVRADLPAASGGKLSDRVYAQLRSQILSHRRSPGSRVTEVGIAEELGVSRTPVREALQTLRSDGLVINDVGGGSYVASISAQDILDTYSVRGVLEGHAASLAALHGTPRELAVLRAILDETSRVVVAGEGRQFARLNREFHDYIADMSHNSRLADLIRSVREFAFGDDTVAVYSARELANSFHGHEDIVSAIANRDSAAADKIAKEHTLHAAVGAMRLLLQDTGEADQH